MQILPLIALGLATFGIATTELVVVGLLPTMSEALGVTIPEAGLLVTGYAAGVVVAAPIVAVITNGLARKETLLGLLVVFTIGNVLCALSTTYWILMLARIVTAVGHAAFFGIASVIATQLVSEDRRASAVAVVFGGAAVATILGVPLGTAIGQAFGWQATFWTVACIGVVAMVAIAAWLPAGLQAEQVDWRGELVVLRDPQVLAALMVTGLTWCSVFAVFTFITPILEDVTHLSEESVIWVLLLFGLGMTVGNFLGGRLGDWHLLPSVVGIIAGIAIMLAVMAIVVHSVALVVISLVLWGVLIFGLAPLLQLWVVSAAKKAPSVASTVNQASFHIGTASGAYIGASALTFGVTYSHLPWVGALMTLIALAVAAMAVRHEFQHRKAVFSVPTPSHAVGH
ncbi:MAG: MFS transporter [Pseudomonadota bacterium]